MATLDNYLLAIRCGHQLGQEPQQTLLAKLLEVIYQEMAYEPIVRLIQHASLQIGDWRAAIEYLQTLKREWVGLDRALTVEMHMPLSMLTELVNEGVNAHKFNPKHAARFLQEYERLAVDYQRSLLEAARRNAPEAYDKKSNALTQSVQQEARWPLLLHDMTARLVVGRTVKEQPTEFMPRVLVSGLFIPPELTARIWVAWTFPNFGKVITKFYVGRTRMNLLILGIALRLYEQEHAELPSTLERLVPTYVPSVPEDPFAEMKPLRYVRENGSWRVYSLGPDRIDQGGRPVLPVGQIEGPGDLVLSSEAAR